MNTRRICLSKGKDYNISTKRCVKKCNLGEKRDKTFKCKPKTMVRIIKKNCESKNKDFNRFTKKCIKKCDISKKRYFYCPTKGNGLVFNPSRRKPCDKTRFGIYEGEEENLYGRTPGEKNYGTYCYPKCPEMNKKYNIDTNRCRNRIPSKEFYKRFTK